MIYSPMKTCRLLKKVSAPVSDATFLDDDAAVVQMLNRGTSRILAYKSIALERVLVPYISDLL